MALQYGDPCLLLNKNVKFRILIKSAYFVSQMTLHVF